MLTEYSIIGAFASFVESGKSIDSITVSEAAYPDVDPSTNWEDFGEVISAAYETNTEEYPKTVPIASGGYQEIMHTQTLRDRILLNMDDTCELFWRMSEGYASEITNDTAQTPGAAKDRFVQGWLKLQLRGLDGADRIVKNVWGKLRLAEPGNWSKDPSRPAYSFDVEFSAINTSEPQTITS